MENIIVSPMLPGEENIIENFIKQIFDIYIAPDYAKEGAETFYKYIASDKIRERSEDSKHKLFTAKIDKQIVGIIETRDDAHICLFFVSPKYQRQGIGKKMFEYAFQGVATDITVNSSPYAVPIYEKLCFSKVNGEMIRNGITYIPMINQ